jgi:TetR/AcrR family transcriptional regulator, cholesterol catabolism regulator
MPEQPDSREKLISVAVDLFADRGFKGTSIRDIANAMGMSISNIYHYFGNKEGLLLAILNTSSKNLMEQLRNVAKIETDPFSRFQILLKTHIRLSTELKKEAKIFFLDEEHLSPEGNEANLNYQREVLDIYRHQLQSLKDSGYIKAGSITILAFNILGVINWNLRWYKPDGRMSLEEVTREIVDFVLYGVLGSGKEEVVEKI